MALAGKIGSTLGKAVMLEVWHIIIRRRRHYKLCGGGEDREINLAALLSPLWLQLATLENPQAKIRSVMAETKTHGHRKREIRGSENKSMTSKAWQAGAGATLEGQGSVLKCRWVVVHLIVRSNRAPFKSHPQFHSHSTLLLSPHTKLNIEYSNPRRSWPKDPCDQTMVVMRVIRA